MSEPVQEKMELVSPATHPLAAELHQKVMDLHAELLVTTPEFPSLLRTIHKHTMDSVLCMVLSEEEIAVIVKGYEKQAQVTIVAEKSASVKKSLKGKTITTDMI